MAVLLVAAGILLSRRPDERPHPHSPAAPVPPPAAVKADEKPPEQPPARPAADAWAPVFAELKRTLAADRFDPPAGAAALKRARSEFPDRVAEVDEFVNGEHRMVSLFLDALPRDRWLASRARVEQYRAWLALVGRPADAADRILRYAGRCAITMYMLPYAEVRGALAGKLPPEDRFTPLALREAEIADGPLELAHPAFGRRVIPIDGLADGKAYVIEGDWAEPERISIREER